MKTVTFGNAFPLKMNYKESPDPTKRYLPTQPLERIMAESDYEDKIAEGMQVVAEYYSQQPTKIIETSQGTYLLTNGPNIDTVNLHNTLSEAARSLYPVTLEGVQQKNEAIESSMNQIDALNDGSPALNVDYHLRKNPNGLIVARPTNLSPIRDIFRTLFPN